MLKLTGCHDDRTLYVTAKHIVGIYIESSGLTIVDTVSHCYRVTETPEQIMAMPEMLYEIYPALSIDAAGKVTKIS